MRLLHLDLLVLLGLGLSLFFFNRAEITASVALTYPVLGYFLIRMLVAGFWPREREGPLVPLAPIRWLAIGVFVLAAGRIALNIIDSHVIDIGVAGVIGADRITGGEPLYEGGFSLGLDLKGDVYGPFNYLSYVPFELIFPWDGVWDAGVGAAHAAAIAFDLTCIVGLVVLGRRLRDGEQGRALGWALGFAWAACPWTLYVMNANANDALIAALGIGALIALRSAPARGVLTGLAAAAKFGPAALAPLFATADGERRWRGALWFSVAFAITAAVVFVPFIPDGGLSEMYDRTLGYQAARSSPFSIWGQAPSLEFAQPLVRALAAVLAIAVAFVPRRKTPVQIAALAAAVTIAVQLTAAHWFYFYVVWFLPFALVAASRRSARSPHGAQAIGVRSSPSWGELTTTSSPGFSQTRGSRAPPTPDGVPVATMSPGSSVIRVERWATSCGIEKIRPAVVSSCIRSPFRSSAIPIASSGPASSRVTIAGPQGAAPSNTFPGIHCGVANCRSRAERSLNSV